MREKKTFIKSSSEKKYKELAEVYLAKYENQDERHIKMMIAKGILVEMESDLVFFHIKNEPTEKSTYQQSRLDILKGIIDYFSDIHSFNYQVKMILGNFYRENEELKQNIEILQKQIKEINEFDEQ